MVCFQASDFQSCVCVGSVTRRMCGASQRDAGMSGAAPWSASACRQLR